MIFHQQDWRQVTSNDLRLRYPVKLTNYTSKNSVCLVYHMESVLAEVTKLRYSRSLESTPL